MKSSLLASKFLDTNNRLTNSEAPQETPIETTELALKIPCHIDNESNPISYLQDGIKLSLTGSITKNSPVLNKDCVYMKTLSINRLVRHIIIINVARISCGTFRKILLEKSSSLSWHSSRKG